MLKRLILSYDLDPHSRTTFTLKPKLDFTMNTIRETRVTKEREIVFLCTLPEEVATQQYQNFVFDVEWYKNVTMVHTETGITFPVDTPPDQYQFELHEADWADPNVKYGHLGHNVRPLTKKISKISYI